MKTNLMLLLITHLISSLTAFSQHDENVIKSISSAEYSPTRSGILKRTEALATKLSSHQLFDKNEHLVEHRQMDPSTNDIYLTYKYSNYKDNLATLIQTYDNKNKLTEYRTLRLNTENKIDTFYTYTSKDIVSSVQIFYYDSNGNTTCRIDSSLTYARTLKWDYEFDEENRMTKRVSYDKDGILKDSRTYKYDKNGKEFESDLLRANGDYTLFKSKYNANGDLTYNFWYDKDGTETNLTTFDYEYDQFGSWITKKRYNDGELNYIWERVIKYYE